MTAELSCDRDTLRKNETAVYSLKITTEGNESSAEKFTINIIPSAEDYPETPIVPDTSALYTEDDISLSGEMTQSGIFEITALKSGAANEFTITYEAVSFGFYDNVTTSAAVSAETETSTVEAYSQTTVSGGGFAPVIIGICAVIFTVAAAAVLLKKTSVK